MYMKNIEKSKSHILFEIIEYVPKAVNSYSGSPIECCKSKRAFQNDLDSYKKRERWNSNVIEFSNY